MKITTLQDFTVARPAVLKRGLMFFLCLSWLTINAQTTVVVGTSTTTTNILGPTTSTTGGPRIERHTAIYRSGELSAGGLVAGKLIMAIGWNKTGEGEYSGSNLGIKIYLKHVSDTSFAANPNFATEISTATLVYSTTSGNIPAAPGIQWFVLNNSYFTWNGSDNLQVITEIVRTASWINTSFDWRGLATLANTGANANGTTAPATLSRTGGRPQLYLDVAATGNDAALTAMPTPVSALPGTQTISVVIRNTGSVTLTSADIGWKINGGPSTNYQWTGSLVPGTSASVDIASPALSIALDTITATVSNPNGGADADPANNTISKIIHICNPLAGNYTINNHLPPSSTNFNTFTAFASALTGCGMSGNVIATVDPGSAVYKEQVIFQNIAGLGSTATLTIKGNGATITSDTAIIQINSNPNRHIIRMIGLQYVTIDSLNIEMAPGSTAFLGIQALNSGSHITIKNCNVNMGTATSTLMAAFVCNGDPASVITLGGTFDDINIVNNSVSGGGYGVSVFGLVSPLATKVTIANNSFVDFNSNGVYLRETDGTIVRGNRFNKVSGTVSVTNAIQYAQSANINGQVFDNQIRLTQSNGAMRGIYLFAGTGHKVYNNTISNLGSVSGAVTGIEIRTTSSAPEISFNTISFNYPGTSSGILAGIKEESPNTLSVLRNNVISITQPTSAYRTALLLASTSTVTTALNSNYNVFYVPDSNIAVRATTIPTKYYTLAAWRAASGQDMSSSDADPMFTADTLLIPKNLAINNVGVQVAGISTDITGAVRGASPDPGAYEFTAPVIYTFTGGGLWNVATNWSGNLIPPSPLPANSEVIINPNDGDCVLNVPFTVGVGGKLTVKDSKTLVVQGNLTIQK
ncbi:MAG: right-handed parallel beta-helix repeat-containing protein [Bacteroidota bacterium]